MAENIHKGHRQRMRVASLQHGMSHYSDHEILEMLLYYSVPRIDTNGLAHALLNRFGSVKDVLDADPMMLQSVGGIGESSAHLIRLMSEILRRYLRYDPTSNYCFSTIGRVAEYLYPKFIGCDRECLYIMLLNDRQNLIKCEKISEGVINCADVMLRKIAELIVISGATMVVLAHNHPRGIAYPSSIDVDTTRTLRDYLSNMNVTLLEHLIFAGCNYATIMKERYGFGRLSPISQTMDADFYERFYADLKQMVHPSLPACGAKE